MDDDYVNKQIVCPTCGGRDMLYIDLNEIRGDPRAGTGAVTRTFVHQNHLLLLDIDHHGDVRTVNQIDKKQKIAINQEKYDLMMQYIDNAKKVLLMSSDAHLELIFESDIETIGSGEHFFLENTDYATIYQTEKKKILWVKDFEHPITIADSKLDIVYFDDEVGEVLDRSDISELISKSELILLESDEMKEKIIFNFDVERVSIV